MPGAPSRLARPRQAICVRCSTAALTSPPGLRIAAGMRAVASALIKACRQLGDPAIVRVAARSVAITLLVFAGLGIGARAALAEAAERLGVSGGWAGVLAVQA